MIDTVQVLTTTGSREEAELLARALIERRLAACVQIVGPISSVYHWQGNIETASEWLCLAKTRQTHYPAVEQAIRELHSYEVPEILALPVVAGSAAYIEWLGGELVALGPSAPGNDSGGGPATR